MDMTYNIHHNNIYCVDIDDMIYGYYTTCMVITSIQHCMGNM